MTTTHSCRCFIAGNLLFISLLVSFSAIFSCRAQTLKVITYAYPDIDRANAVSPIAMWLEKKHAAVVEIDVLKTLDDLRLRISQGDYSVALPNLTGYLLVISETQTVPILVPNQHPTASGYSSSIIGLHVPALDEWSQQGSLKAYAVWPNSASGGLIGRSWLKQNITKHYARIDFTFVGSHAKVAEHVSQDEGAIGILASQEFLKHTPPLKELWRSPQIPFGPLLCNPEQLDCATLTEDILKDKDGMRLILKGLQTGWSEFSESTELVSPVISTYQSLAEVISSP
ncbi:PhnD/SsuA/transferrin family substrate-binding protein [Bowmanella yangjiangensis]|uniref:PhnD/SsuA/transferrin family substrate-binding protein n=1 Tax=Bowmanella yangjiangensis TaxID=2811230 RepID=A0ABS3CZY8_9ALTE|nr:PhnD/SsuA/transferrin family substrate-binding protein [Bowmanella yangjiangensis]MBN7821951.1 PhnD/SsuA/transferrin family substrate-binding protein [Bowmanella yangjiangensis]